MRSCSRWFATGARALLLRLAGCFGQWRRGRCDSSEELQPPSVKATVTASTHLRIGFGLAMLVPSELDLFAGSARPLS
jgi:hypothetical protein